LDTLFATYKKLARAITIVENELPGNIALLETLQLKPTPIIGFTGSPGAGKSSLVNMICTILLEQQKKIGIIAVDPTSPFNYGSLLGDRLRLATHFNNPNLYIRSLATRGSLGGLCEKILEIADVMRSYDFDYIIVETVGVGQSEVEIAGLAHATIVVLTPDGGDDVQLMKSGIMEIANLFVINKADRPGADGYAKKIEMFLHEKDMQYHTDIIKTIATENVGGQDLVFAIQKFLNSAASINKKNWLLYEKAIKLIQKQRMKNIDRRALMADIETAAQLPSFNIYSFINKYI
jgi:LAO/AO transport system kinase